MRHVAVVCLGLALWAVRTVQAQGLTMQMSNGWSFTFSGNVNAFIYYEKSNSDGNTTAPGGVTPPLGVVNATRITTGLLPAFAVFDAKGKEGNTDLGVHFGFAPEVQCATGVNDCFGAQIDMRQVYLTVGGAWGQVLVGRELGLYARPHRVRLHRLGAPRPDPPPRRRRPAFSVVGRPVRGRGRHPPATIQ